MMRAIRAVSGERGRDPREFALFAFGNGPLFAAGMARALEITRVIVPPAPGLFSAFGLLYSEVEHLYVRTWCRRTRGLDPAALSEVLVRMEAAAVAQLGAEGFRGRAARITRSADCRYAGQPFELTVPVPPGSLDAAAVSAIDEAFARRTARGARLDGDAAGQPLSGRRSLVTRRGGAP